MEHKEPKLYVKTDCSVTAVIIVFIFGYGYGFGFVSLVSDFIDFLAGV